MATQLVDGRKGPDCLMALVRDVLRHDPLSGHLFVFFTMRRDRIRIVYWDSDGIAMWTSDSLEAGFDCREFRAEPSESCSTAPSSRCCSAASTWSVHRANRRGNRRRRAALTRRCRGEQSDSDRLHAGIDTPDEL